MWGKHHVIPIQAKRGLGGAVIVDDVLSLTKDDVQEVPELRSGGLSALMTPVRNLVDSLRRPSSARNK
jgi:hypothetical protein